MNTQEAFDILDKFVAKHIWDLDYSNGCTVAEAVRAVHQALDERERLRGALENIEALADRDKQRHDGVEVFVEALLPDILVLARAALKGGNTL